MLTKLYSAGIDVKQNDKEAMKWLKQAYDYQSDVRTSFGMGCMYYYGTGVKKNCAATLYYFKGISHPRFQKKKHYGYAHYFMADIYEHGKDSVPQDYKKASGHYTRSAKSGFTRAVPKMEALCSQGYGVEINEDNAVSMVDPLMYFIRPHAF